MISNESAAPVNAWDKTKKVNSLIRAIGNICAIVEMDLRKLRHDASELITRAIQPILWLLIFGQAFSRIRAVNTGPVSYQAFMTPGILAQSVMFISIFYGISIIWERDMGILQKFMAMPIPRVALVLGKALSAGVRALSQAVVIILLVAVLGIPLRWQVGTLLGAVGVTVLGGMFFSTLSMAIACLVKTRERFMGLGQLITMPLFFASNALYPISIMPAWLRVVAKVNPLSYMVDFLRGALVTGELTNWPRDVMVLGVAFAVFAGLVTYLYPRLAS